MIRLFIALPLSATIQQTLHAMGRSLPGTRPTAPEQIHITLRFIGEVEGSLFHDIRDSLSAVTMQPFTLAIRGVGHFPLRGKPRVVWAGLSPVEQISRLKKHIDNALQECGLPPDTRKFFPHVTMARLNDCPLGRLTQFLAGNSFLCFDGLHMDSFHLYSSNLTSKGAIHTLEAQYPITPL